MQDPPALPYLSDPERHTFDIHLEAALLPAGRPQATVVSYSNFCYLCAPSFMSWTLPLRSCATLGSVLVLASPPVARHASGSSSMQAGMSSAAK